MRPTRATDSNSLYLILYLGWCSLGIIVPIQYDPNLGDFILFLVLSWIFLSWASYHVIIKTQHSIWCVMSLLFYIALFFSEGMDLGLAFYSSGSVLAVLLILMILSTLLAFAPIHFAYREIKFQDKRHNTNTYQKYIEHDQNAAAVGIIINVILIFITFVLIVLTFIADIFSIL